ncbi:filamentous hemagglutinin family N-terminal domain-containing protein [Selenomonas ruminantium]|uniref:Filamentous hemagglutinin family N-terminal domain-containing protein n=1 Tax=Selenomonas ruminantium TaxID=971 RepID=A0A1M6UNA4_SELRU|nr:filamentous hemagglutinin N-terminal domain-containing protein [Selenomonas ruminantium]SHK70603.1 filamentous hemagglutinin family N-terminal domain-containing protein [Selenomonas ruminantium]
MQVSIALAAGMFSIVPVAYGAPVGGTSSTATITYSDVKDSSNNVIGQDTSVVGSVTNNVIDWHDFSVDKNEKVVFAGNKNYMNIVTGANTSDINGKIQGGGEVYIVNPNGVMIGKDAEINVGSFYASTREIAVSDAVAAATNANSGNGSMSSVIAAGTSTSGAAMDVVNMGKIQATEVVLEGENIRILNSADITSDGSTPLTNKVTVRADEGYIHVGSSDGSGGANYTKGNVTSTGAVAAVEQYILVDKTNWASTLGTGSAVSGNYMLADNIVATDITNFKNVSSFSGKFDGNFFTISKLSGSGLFGSTTSATIENLGVTDSSFSNSGGPAGAIVATANATKLNNVYNEGSPVSGSMYIYSGGLVGSADGVTIKNSYNTGAVSGGSGGGLIGMVADGTNRVENSYSTGSANGLVFSAEDANGTISFENVIGTAAKFFDIVAGSAPTGTNSLVLNNNQGEYYDGSGNSSTISGVDRTTLSTYTSGAISWVKNSDISDIGGVIKDANGKLIRPAWRIYEGKTEPVLTVFTKGIKNTVYDFEYFAKDKTTGQYTDKDTAAYKYSTKSNSNVGNNKGKDLTAYVYATTSSGSDTPGLIYNAETLKIVDANGDAATSTNNLVDDYSAVFNTQGTSTIKGNVYYNAAGQKDALANNAKMALIWSDQKGYDLVGNNIAIAPRQVTITNNFTTQSIVKEYDGSDDAKSFVSGLFSGSSSSVSGILAEDSADIKVTMDSGTATFRNVNSDGSLTAAGAAGNENVGKNKKVQINGTLSLTNGSGGTYTGSNYVVVNATGTTGNSVQINSPVNAAITQREIKVSLNSGLGITKVYDGDAYVKDAQGNNRTFTSSDFNLDPENKILPADQNNTTKLDLTVTPSNNTKYIDLSTKTDQVDAGTHDVAIAGISLTGTSADNYVLTDLNGTPIYSKQDLVTGYNQTTQVGQNGGGPLYTTGDITLRTIPKTGFKWYNSVSLTAPHGPVYQTATKEYDGTATYSEPVNSWVSNAPTTTSTTYTTTGMLPGDDLELQVNSAEFTQNSTDTNSATNLAVKDAYVSGASQGVRYNVTITGTAAKNYTFDGTTALANGVTETVLGEGEITPRTIYITTPTAGTVTKTYNGNDVVENGGKTYFGLNDGYFTYADNNAYHHIVKDSNGNDDAEIVITGQYQNMVDSNGNTVLAKDVYYDATNTANPILDKNIVYTATIVQNMPQQTGNTLTVNPSNYASTNYRFNIAPNTNQVTFNGTGNITQVQLGTITFADVNKTFDNSYKVTNTNVTTAPQYTDDKIKINTPTGIISTETVADVFYVDSQGYLDNQAYLTDKGVPLLDNTNGPFKAKYGRLSSSGFTPNEHVYRDGNGNVQAVSVEYDGISSLLRNHNYKLDAPTAASDKVYGTGTINPFLVTNKSWINLNLNGTPIEKTYDGTDTITNPLNYVQTTGPLNNKADITISPVAGQNLPGLSATVAGAHYKDEHSHYDVVNNQDTAQDVIYELNISETGDYGIDNSLKVNQQANGLVELTLTNGGVIKRKEIIANTPKNADYTKTYDATDVISDMGNKLIDISNDILQIDKNRVTNATTAKYVTNSTGAAEDASYNNGDKTVEYTLKLQGDTYNDYYLHDGNGSTTVNGAGTINKRNLQISGPSNHQKTYDGNTNVTDMPTALSGFTFGDSDDITVLTKDNFAIGALTGTYGTGNTDATFNPEPNVGNKTVQYSGFFTALGNRARNYTINGADNTNSLGTAYGAGIISPAQFSGSFVLKLKNGITQIYSGSNVVGQLESDTTSAAKRAFQESWIDLTNSGIKLTSTSTGIDVTLASIGSSNYNIDSAVFTAGADVGTGKNVAYQITLNPTYVSNNFTGMPTTVTFQDSINDGEIKAREVTVELTQLAKDGLTKTYDGTGDIYKTANKAFSTDSTVGVIAQGDDIIQFEAANTTNHTGLVKGTNTSTGEYTPNINVGGTVVEYTASISGDKASNYIFKDVNGNTLVNGKSAALTTNNNTITPFGVVLETPASINKTYDSTEDVALSDVQTAFQNKLKSGVGNETVTLQGLSATTGQYVGADVNPDTAGNPTPHVVHYTGLSLGNTTPANYIMVDSTGQELSKDSNGLYQIDGTGTISPFSLLPGTYTINFAPAEKDYDATQEVWKNNGQTSLTNNYIEDHYITLGNGVQQNLTFSSYFAEYDTPNATGTANGATQVNYRLGLGGGNYDLTALRNAQLVNANGELLISDLGNINANYGTAASTINKATVYAGLTNNPLDADIVKTYDTNNDVLQDVSNKVEVTGLFTSQDGTKLNVQAINAHYDDEKVARDAQGNVVDKDVYYHVELEGAAKDNYKIVGAAGAAYNGTSDNTGDLMGKGRIDPVELTVDFKKAERLYKLDVNGDAETAVNASDIQVDKFNGLLGTDSIANFSTALIHGEYGEGDTEAVFNADGNVKRDGQAVGYKSVKYSNLEAAYKDYLVNQNHLNTAAANYTLKDTTFYGSDQKKGRINPVMITELKAKWQGVDKVYDATPDVLDSGSVMQLVTTSPLDQQEIEVSYSGADRGIYVDNTGAAQKDVGNHGLMYNVTEVNKNLGNYQLDDTTANNAKRDWISTTAADNVGGLAVTGEITARPLNVIAKNGFHKIYDGDGDIDADQIQERIGFSAADLSVLQKDIAAGEISYDVAASYADGDANVAPGVIRNLKDVNYSLTLQGNTKGNYVLQGAVNDVVTKTEKLGDIEQRQVFVEAVDITGIDKTYDTTKALPDGYSNNGHFKLRDVDADTGVIAGEDVELDLAAIQGEYVNGHVQRDDNGNLMPQQIDFTTFRLKGNDNLANYVMQTDSLSGSGTISPAPLTVTINSAPVKTYDGETSMVDPDVGDVYTANKNVKVEGWLQEADKANVLLTDIGYQDGNAGKNKEYAYHVSLGNTDYTLTQGTETPAVSVTDNGQEGTVTAYDGTITPRILTASVIKTMTKEYDGEIDGVENAQNNISLSNYIDKDKDNLGLTATAVYDNPNAGKSEDTDELENHEVRYTLNLSNANYQLADSTVEGTGTIYRKGLTIVAAPAAVNVGEAMPEFTGSVEGLVEKDSAWADAFTFAPKAETTTNTPGSYEVFGWYSNRTLGNLGLNYTFAQAPANDRAFTVNYVNTSNDNPDTKITPNSDVYNQISKDMNSGFGDNSIAAIEYRDKNGQVVAREDIGSGGIRGFGNDETNEDLVNPGTKLADIGIVGGDIVNIEGVDAASSAQVQVSGDGTVINLEVQPLQAETSGTSSIAQIQVVDDSRKLEESEDKTEKNDKESEIGIESTNSQDDDEIELKVEDQGVNVA